MNKAFLEFIICSSIKWKWRGTCKAFL